MFVPEAAELLSVASACRATLRLWVKARSSGREVRAFSYSATASSSWRRACKQSARSACAAGSLSESATASRAQRTASVSLLADSAD